MSKASATPAPAGKENNLKKLAWVIVSGIAILVVVSFVCLALRNYWKNDGQQIADSGPNTGVVNTTINVGNTQVRVSMPAEYAGTPKGLVSMETFVLEPGQSRPVRSKFNSLQTDYGIETGKLVHFSFQEGNRVALFPQSDGSVKALADFNYRGGSDLPQMTGAAWVNVITNKDEVPVTITVYTTWKQ